MGINAADDSPKASQATQRPSLALRAIIPPKKETDGASRRGS